MNALRPYPKYNRSMAGWVQHIPKHWQILRNRYIFRELDNKSSNGMETLLSVSQYTGVTPRSGQENDTETNLSRSESLEGYRVVTKNNLVVNIMVAWNGSLGFSNYDGIVSPAYCVYRPESSIVPRYMHYQMRSVDYLQEIRKESTGIVDSRLRLYSDRLFSIRSLIPPLDEQIAIANFLDAMDERINRYIAAKRQMIQLLEEKKQAIINQAVTRGLDPDVPLKPSGVDWLGDIPAHWETKALKQEVVNFDSRRVPLSSEVRGSMHVREYPYYGASGVIDHVDDYLFDGSYLLIAEDGANLVLRNLPLAIVARGRFWVNNHAHILQPRRGSLEYYAALLESIDYSPWISGAAQPKLTQDRLMSMRIPVPPVGEQLLIGAYILEEFSAQLQTISRLKMQVTLVREYRMRVVSDVVTGKLDVRSVDLPQLEEVAAIILDTTANGLFDENDVFVEPAE